MSASEACIDAIAGTVIGPLSDDHSWPNPDSRQNDFDTISPSETSNSDCQRIASQTKAERPI